MEVGRMRDNKETISLQSYIGVPLRITCCVYEVAWLGQATQNEDKFYANFWGNRLAHLAADFVLKA